EEEDKLFEETMRLVTQEFTYARYQPLLYYKEEKLDQLEEQAQKNMGAFMKVLLVKRLESSFFAFRQTINRFIRSYERFIEEFDRGRVFISKKYAEKIFDLLDNDDEEAIQKLIDEDKARMLPASGFKKEFREHLEKDLNILKEIRRLWLGMSRDPKLQKLQHVLEAIMTLTCTQGVKRDPSLLELQHELSTQPFRGKNKLIIFTESKETAEYLKENLGSPYSEETLVYTGSSPAAVRDAVIDNFDANSDNPKDDYRILISTDILSEGVNLHRSNIVVNYDIPWNPTRMMQRVGRINRVDTKFDRIYTFNFFPTKQSNERIKLKEAAQAKIHAFITMLGADAPLLTDGEPIESFELFNRLISKKTILGEDDAEESELKYLQIIRDIQLKNPDLFNTIKRLPKKARTAKKLSDGDDSERLLTYFRKGKLEKFYLCDKDKPQELDFISTAKLLEAEPHTPRQSLPKSYYELLEKNKQAFKEATTEEEEIGETNRPSGRDTASKLWRMLKGLKSQFSKQFTEDQEKYWDTVMESLWNGELPKKTCQKVFRELEQELKNNQNNPLKIISVLQKNIPEAFLKSHITDREGITSSPREVILSEILIG
ncbi:MAG: helicase-related protein, partial [Candidatus Nitrosotenuis sp.]